MTSDEIRELAERLTHITALGVDPQDDKDIVEAAKALNAMADLVEADREWIDICGCCGSDVEQALTTIEGL